MLLMLAGSALADVIDTVIEQMICISMAVAIMKLAAGHGDFVGAAKYKCKISRMSQDKCGQCRISGNRTAAYWTL